MESNSPFLVRVSVIGEAQVGKSRLREIFSSNTFTDPYICTISCDFVLFTQSVVRLRTARHSLRLQIWDIAGQECFRLSSRSFYKGSKGILLAYDITNRTSFERATSWTDDFRKWVPDAPAVLVGTKVDLTAKREVH